MVTGPLAPRQMARVNGIYKRELTVGFELVNNTGVLIELPGQGNTTLPNGREAAAYGTEFINSKIGFEAYDIGAMVSWVTAQRANTQQAMCSPRRAVVWPACKACAERTRDTVSRGSPARSVGTRSDSH